MVPEPFARRFTALAQDQRLQPPVADRIIGAAPEAYVLTGDPSRPLVEGGSALAQADRDALAERLPAGHLLTLDGGHCLHREAPAEWLATVAGIIG